MLVLSRKSGERIAIDGDIQLEVLEVTGNRVRLGIVAPDDCRIMRAERIPPKTPLQATRQPIPSGDSAPVRRLNSEARAHSHPVSHSLPTGRKTGSLPVRG